MNKRRKDYEWARSAVQALLAISKAKVKADCPLMIGAWCNGQVIWTRQL
jgi:hypothetical protein